MKKVIIGSVILLVLLYFYITWKKKQSVLNTNANTTKASDTPLALLPQKNDNVLSNVSNIRNDHTTAQDVIDANVGGIDSSATANNPVTRENPTPVTLDEIGVISIDSIPEIKSNISPIGMTLGNSNGIMTVNNPITANEESTINTSGVMTNVTGDTLLTTLPSGQLVYQKSNGDTYTIWPDQKVG